MSSTLSRTEAFSLLALFGLCTAILANTFQGDGAPLVASLAFSGLAFDLTYAFVRWSGSSFMHAGLKGKDLGKAVPKEMYVLKILFRVKANPCVVRNVWEPSPLLSTFWH